MTDWSKWDNEDRNRYYGLRVGDIVKSTWIKDEPELEVIEYGHGDNNRIYLKSPSGKTYSPTAESCDIITKLEDRK